MGYSKPHQSHIFTMVYAKGQIRSAISMETAKKFDYHSAARALKPYKDAQRAATFRSYFKDITGETFLGVTTPIVRRIAREFWPMPLREVRRLMKSTIHEERSLANEILRLKFQKGSPEQRQQVYDFYLKNRHFIYSWDGVDGSAPYIVGCHLLKRDKSLLYQLATSSRIWDRRIAIVATWWFIRHGKIADTLKMAKILLQDKEDLIHKATGWMLREAGKQDVTALKKFLNVHSKAMPRVMLRYAIERFPERDRQRYLNDI